MKIITTCVAALIALTLATSAHSGGAGYGPPKKSGGSGQKEKPSPSIKKSVKRPKKSLWAPH